jgi:LuxR family maltose regulon positive regulatory protein
MATASTPLHLVPQPPGLPFDVLRSKLRVPEPRPGSVWRTALVNRLRATRSSPLVTLVAPAGYGKTTVLAQWANRDDRQVAWLSLDERDDEPVVLLRHLAAALDELEPVGPEVLQALAEPGESVWTSAVPRLTDALESLRPCAIVLDNASLVHSKSSVDLLAALVDHLPPGSTLLLAGRAEPRLPLAALRAAGRLLELGPIQLGMTEREAEQLVRATGLELTPQELETLLLQGAGWPAGLYLGALAIDESGDSYFGGDDRYLSDYFRTSCLQGLSRATLEFLRRTSVLEKLSGPLCDAVLSRTRSTTELAALHRRGLFLLPIDRRREWYRYHPLFRDLLRRELDEHEPGAACELRLRAADWFETAGDIESAVAAATAAGQTQRAARLIVSAGPQAGAGCVERWLEHLPELELDANPELAAVVAQVQDTRGRALEAESRSAAAALTSAELRLLPMLATHFSFREIGDRLYLSRHTVKTQAISTYRKLGVSSRSAAVETATVLGLIQMSGGPGTSGPPWRGG